MWMNRADPARQQACAIRWGSCAWARLKSGPKGSPPRLCKMPTRFTTKSQPATNRSSVASSCTSACITVTVGCTMSSRPRLYCRVGTCTTWPWATSRPTRWRPIKPAPPITSTRMSYYPCKPAMIKTASRTQHTLPNQRFHHSKSPQPVRLFRLAMHHASALQPPDIRWVQ